MSEHHVQIQDPTTGEWTDLRTITHFEPTVLDESTVDEEFTQPTSWSMTLPLKGDTRGLWEHLERLAREQRWAARAWLRHPLTRPRLRSCGRR